MAKTKFYAYSLDNGKTKGITLSWPECEAIIKGKDAKYKSFPSDAEAKEWLMNGAKYTYKPASEKSDKPFVSSVLKPGIYFDAGTGRGIGTEVKVTDEKGNNLLSTILTKEQINPYGNYLTPKGSTNNYGELFGCYLALNIAIGNKITSIFGDSKLVIDYWSRGHAKVNELPENTVSLINKVKVLRAKFEALGGKITHVSGDINPADLGFHR